jgi:hypothetical protein
MSDEPNRCDLRAGGGCTVKGTRAGSLFVQYRLVDGEMVDVGRRCWAHLVRLPEEHANCTHAMATPGRPCPWCGTPTSKETT